MIATDTTFIWKYAETVESTEAITKTLATTDSVNDAVADTYC